MNIKNSIRIAQSLCLVTMTFLGAPVGLVLGTPAAPAFAQDSTDAEVLIQVARRLIDKKQLPQAAEKLRQFLSQFPNEKRAPNAALALGNVYSQMGQYDEAISPYEKASRSSDATISGPALLGLGEAALKAKKPDYARSAQALEAATRTKLPEDQAAVAYYWLAQSNFQLGKFAQSEEAYVKITTSYPRAEFVDDAYFSAGLAALRQNKAQVARDRFKTVADRYPNSPNRIQALLLVAQSDAVAKNWPEAQRGFERILADPKTRADKDITNQAEEGLTRSLLEQGKFADAAPKLQNLLSRLSPNDPLRARTALTLGNAQFRGKSYSAAASSYREAARSADPNISGEASYWLGSSLLADTKYAEAATAFNDMATKNPKHPLAAKAALKAGDAYLAAKNSPQALKAYNLVINNYSASPEAVEAKKGRAEAIEGVTDPAALEGLLGSLSPVEKSRASVILARGYLEKKNYAGMVSVLGSVPPIGGSAVGTDADTLSEVQYLLGIAYEAQAQGKPELAQKAIRAFTESIRISDKTPFAADAQLRLPNLYSDAKDHANAQKSAEAALGRNPTPELRRQLQLVLAQALIDQAKYPQAIEVTRQIASSNPPADVQASLLQTQAYLYEKTNRSAEALPIWEKIAADRNNPAAPDALVRVGDARLKAALQADGKTYNPQQLEAAVQRYQQVVTQFPTSKAAPNARYKLATSLYNLKKYSEAAAEYDKLQSDSEYAEEALYWGGLAHYNNKRYADAAQRLKQFVGKYASSAYFKDAKVKLALIEVELASGG